MGEVQQQIASLTVQRCNNWHETVINWRRELHPQNLLQCMKNRSRGSERPLVERILAQKQYIFTSIYFIHLWERMSERMSTQGEAEWTKLEAWAEWLHLTTTLQFIIFHITKISSRKHTLLAYIPCCIRLNLNTAVEHLQLDRGASNRSRSIHTTFQSPHTEIESSNSRIRHPSRQSRSGQPWNVVEDTREHPIELISHIIDWENLDRTERSTSPNHSPFITPSGYEPKRSQDNKLIAGERPRAAPTIHE